MWPSQTLNAFYSFLWFAKWSQQQFQLCSRTHFGPLRSGLSLRYFLLCSSRSHTPSRPILPFPHHHPSMPTGQNWACAQPEVVTRETKFKRKTRLFGP